MMKSVADVDVSGKRVLLRTSLNVPVDEHGAVEDVYRLQRALPTLEHLVKNGARVVVVGYFGRKGETLKPVAEALMKLVPHIPMRFSDVAISDAAKEVDSLKNGECLVLENMRREAGEEKNDPALCAALAKLVDVFVSDAFAEAHRAYASNVGIAALLPSYAGFLMQEEVARLSQALTPPKGSLAVIGGAKFETKEPLILKLLSLYETLLLGGALGSDVIKARGNPVGVSLLSDTPVPTAIASNERLLVANDAAVLNVETKMGRSCFVSDIRSQESIYDIGPGTAQDWANYVMRAPFVLWNGTMGVCEKGFVEGTERLAHALIESKASGVIGGGDTVAAIAKFSFDPARVFISTGGGAMLQFLVDGTLPALEVLKK